jgi:hypothetical protein
LEAWFNDHSTYRILEVTEEGVQATEGHLCQRAMSKTEWNEILGPGCTGSAGGTAGKSPTLNLYSQRVNSYPSLVQKTPFTSGEKHLLHLAKVSHKPTSYRKSDTFYHWPGQM